MKKIKRIVSEIIAVNYVSKNIRLYTGIKQIIHFKKELSKKELKKIEKEFIDIPTVSLHNSLHCLRIELKNCHVILLVNGSRKVMKENLKRNKRKK